MTAPFAWWWPTLAAAFTVVAVVTYRNYAVAVPAAALAVLAAAVAVADAVRRTSTSRPAPPRARPIPPSGVRDWLLAGELGREDIVLLLDRLERRLVHPDLPAQTPQQIATIAATRPADFRRYVAARLAELEGTA